MWELIINVKLADEWNISMTASEYTILTMLRAGYGSLETQLKELAKAPITKRPYELVDEALALLRCLVFNRLEPINGKFITLNRTGGGK